MYMRKTKRLLSAVLVLSMLLCLCLTACGNSKDCVPDSYIDEDIQRFIKSNYSGPEREPSSYSFTVEHSPDTSAHKDEVVVNIVFEYEYGTAEFSASGRYRYAQSDDLWDGILHFEYGERNSTFDESALRKSFDFSGFDAGHEINVKSIDLSGRTITCDYTMERSHLWTSKEAERYSGSGTFPLEEWYKGHYSFVIVINQEEHQFYITPEHGISSHS